LPANITNAETPSAIHAPVVEADLPTCIVCLEDDHRDGVLCPSGHFVCRTCLDPLVGAHVEKPLAERTADCGHIRCPDSDCQYRLEPQAIAREVPRACFDSFLRSLSEVTEKMARDKLLQEIEEERLRQPVDVIEQHRRYLMDRILTLVCPRCRQAFVDFDGCLALSCGGCGADFCGYFCELWTMSCLLISRFSRLMDCGEDAHAHVAVCPEAHHTPAWRSLLPVWMQKRPDSLFILLPEWEKFQRRRRLRLANEYLLTLPADLRAQVRQACLRELQELEQ